MSRSNTPPIPTLLPSSASTPESEAAIIGSVGTPPTLEGELVQKVSKLRRLSSGTPKHSVKKGDKWSNLFDSNICIGEPHEDITPKKFLIDNMGLFHEKGYKVLFLEHVSQSEHLELLESYHESGEMDESLKTYLAKMDAGHMGKGRGSDQYEENKLNYNFTQVVIKARESGIKVVPLEESAETYNSYRGGSSRMAILNEGVTGIISGAESDYSKNNDGDLKWLAFVGSAHLYEFGGVPGICEVLPNVQDIYIRDASKSVKSGTAIYDEPTHTINEIKSSIVLVQEIDSDLSYDTISTRVSEINESEDVFSLKAAEGESVPTESQLENMKPRMKRIIRKKAKGLSASEESSDKEPTVQESPVKPVSTSMLFDDFSSDHSEEDAPSPKSLQSSKPYDAISGKVSNPNKSADLFSDSELVVSSSRLPNESKAAAMELGLGRPKRRDKTVGISITKGATSEITLDNSKKLRPSSALNPHHDSESLKPSISSEITKS